MLHFSKIYYFHIDRFTVYNEILIEQYCIDAAERLSFCSTFYSLLPDLTNVAFRTTYKKYTLLPDLTNVAFRATYKKYKERYPSHHLSELIAVGFRAT